MSFTIVTDPVVGDPIKASTIKTINENTQDLNARVSLIEDSGIINGSFEFDLDASGVPDSWTEAFVGAGSAAIVPTADSIHGSFAWELTVTAALNDAVTIESESFSIASYGEFHQVITNMKNASGVKVTINVLWYDGAATPSLVATEQVYQSATALAAYTSVQKAPNPAQCPTGAKFYRYQLIVGGPGETTAGSVFVDGVSSQLYHGFIALGLISFGPTGGGVFDVSAHTSGAIPRTIVATGSTGNLEGWSGSAWSSNYNLAIGTLNNLKVMCNDLGQINDAANSTFDLRGYDV